MLLCCSSPIEATWYGGTASQQPLITSSLEGRLCPTAAPTPSHSNELRCSTAALPLHPPGMMALLLSSPHYQRPGWKTLPSCSSHSQPPLWEALLHCSSPIASTWNGGTACQQPPFPATWRGGTAQLQLPLPESQPPLWEALLHCSSPIAATWNRGTAPLQPHCCPRHTVALGTLPSHSAGAPPPCPCHSNHNLPAALQGRQPPVLRHPVRL